MKVKLNEMVEKKLLDSEYEWIFRTCTNAFNVYITMMHFIFYDNTLNLRPENSGKFNAEEIEIKIKFNNACIFLNFQKFHFCLIRYS